MPDYISREAAIKAVAKWINDVFGISTESGAGTLYKKLRSIPAADVRPVVLCRDCQYFENDCGWCGYFDIGMNVNDFCSRGKREES